MQTQSTDAEIFAKFLQMTGHSINSFYKWTKQDRRVSNKWMAGEAEMPEEWRLWMEWAIEFFENAPVPQSDEWCAKHEKEAWESGYEDVTDFAIFLGTSSPFYPIKTEEDRKLFVPDIFDQINEIYNKREAEGRNPLTGYPNRCETADKLGIYNVESVQKFSQHLSTFNNLPRE